MENLKRKGWVRLHRQIEDNCLWFLESFTKGQAWIDLFLNANHKDGIISIRGNIIPIKRGQIGWSELTMGKRWKWSRGKVRRFIKLLKTIHQIEQLTTPLTTIITIINYETYQADSTTDNTAERQQKDNRRYTNNNDKNVKNNNNIYSRVIIDYLNLKANKSFKYDNGKTKDIIAARLNEGFTIEDFKKVIDVKVKGWLYDEKMNQYLRPITLFSNRFESYLQEANTKPINEQPKKIAWKYDKQTTGK